MRYDYFEPAEPQATGQEPGPRVRRVLRVLPDGSYQEHSAQEQPAQAPWPSWDAPPPQEPSLAWDDPRNWMEWEQLISNAEPASAPHQENTAPKPRAKAEPEEVPDLSPPPQPPEVPRPAAARPLGTNTLPPPSYFYATAPALLPSQRVEPQESLLLEQLHSRGESVAQMGPSTLVLQPGAYLVLVQAQLNGPGAPLGLGLALDEQPVPGAWATNLAPGPITLHTLLVTQGGPLCLVNPTGTPTEYEALSLTILTLAH